ncbi:hypothetical protein L9F63_019052, partial [Diploptera punctata]
KILQLEYRYLAVNLVSLSFLLISTATAANIGNPLYSPQTRRMKARNLTLAAEVEVSIKYLTLRSYHVLRCGILWFLPPYASP